MSNANPPLNVSLLNSARTLLQDAGTVVCFSGAGLSAESGIATFRDTETHALWSRFDPMKLASPEGFAESPTTVIDWYNWRRQTLAAAQPNAGHRALATQQGLVQITQNVVDLLERAGCNPRGILLL
ncbi:MAG TPA: Sir2 family NAD-dependent protein deacetylase, partial [Dongiaceae bacterium]|nr:Sir2 family NAD-dependent protein deacetylase [Dongiaceae bacterium]